MDREQLIAGIDRGDALEYLFFWGHRPSANGVTTKSCLSQWFEAGFDQEGRHYRTAEHYMMAGKAELFDDLSARDEILAASDPGKAKALGRRVKGYDEEIWLQHRWGIVVQANLLKFSQHPPLRRFLLGTRPTVLVEASPMDAIWGIGLAWDAPDASDPRRWPGLNLLGFALMEVRDRLATASTRTQVSR